jgi:DNA polymerase-4
VASQEAKPDGLLLVPPDRELAFLHPLPVRRLWGVGVKTADKLHTHGIETVSDVAELSESTLAAMVGGAMGRQLFALSRNIDRRRVVTGVRRRSVGAQRALGRRGSTMSAAEVDAVVINLIDRITRRMRNAGRTGRTVVLRLRFEDFSRVTRSHTMPRATASTDVVLAAARELVAAAAPLIAERGLTLVGFAVSNIDRHGAQQLELPFEVGPPACWVHADTVALDGAVDDVRRRYGNSAVTRGVLVGRDPGLEMPHLPD